jgi:hypothetical protein
MTFFISLTVLDYWQVENSTEIGASPPIWKYKMGYFHQFHLLNTQYSERSGN